MLILQNSKLRIVTLIWIFVIIILLSGCSDTGNLLSSQIPDDTAFKEIREELSSLWELGVAINPEVISNDFLNAYHIVLELVPDIEFGIVDSVGVELMVSVYAHLLSEQDRTFRISEDLIEKLKDNGLFNLYVMLSNRAFVMQTLEERNDLKQERIEFFMRRTFFDFEMDELKDGVDMLSEPDSIAGPIFARLNKLGLTMQKYDAPSFYSGGALVTAGPNIKILKTVQTDESVVLQNQEILNEIIEEIRDGLGYTWINLDDIDGFLK